MLNMLLEIGFICTSGPFLIFCICSILASFCSQFKVPVIEDIQALLGSHVTYYSFIALTCTVKHQNVAGI